MFKIIILFLLIVIFILLIIRFTKKDDFNVLNNEILKPIPKIIHKIYIQHSGKMAKFPLEPKELQEAHDSWKLMNPGYKIKYYSMKDCREYLKKHFEDSDFLQAFDCLNGYSKKCNFFRYCVLYNEGGWYSDWKQVCLKNNLLDELDKNKKDHIIISWDEGGNIQKNGKFIQNCFIGAIKNNLFLKECINEIINNVKYKYYGNTPLDESGPGLLGKMYKKYWNKFKINLKYHNFKIHYNNQPIINHKCYNCGINQDWKNGNNYGVLWKGKKLYSDFKIKGIIPKIIHKTGPQTFNNLSSDIIILFNNIKKNNTDYEFKYYDDNDCYNLINNNFSSSVIWAYNKLKPTAYKADLFRYCVLYLYGGIYSDLTQDFLIPINNLIDFNKDTLILTEDRKVFPYKFEGIQISFVACIPKLEIFKECINKIIENCMNLYYGNTPLDVTGPYLFKNILNSTNVNYIIKLYQINDKFLINKSKKKIIKNKTPNHQKILYNQNNVHYSVLWNKKNIYN